MIWNLRGIDIKVVRHPGVPVKRICLTASLFLSALVVGALAQAPTHELDAVDLTLGWQQGVPLDAELYHLIDSTLALARTVNDTLDTVHAQTYNRYDRLYLLFRDGQSPVSWVNGTSMETGDADLDELSESYNLVSVDPSDVDPDLFLLTFAQPLNMYYAPRTYYSLWRIEFAFVPEEDRAGVGTHDGEIFLRIRDEEYYYVFRKPAFVDEDGLDWYRFWYVHVGAGGAELVNRQNIPNREATDVYLWAMPFGGYAKIYEDYDRLLGYLSPEETWWYREHALYTLYVLSMNVYPYALEVENTTEPNPLSNPLYLTQKLRGEQRASQILAVESEEEEAPGRSPLEWFYIRSQETMDALTPLLSSPDTLQNHLAQIAYDRLSEWQEEHGVFQRPYPFYLQPPDSAGYLHMFSDTLRWEWAYETDSSAYFDYMVTATWWHPGATIDTFVTDSTWVSIATLRDSVDLQKERTYEVEVLAVRNSTGFEREGIGVYEFEVSEYGPFLPFSPVMPEDDLTLSLEEAESVRFEWTSTYEEGWPLRPVYILATLQKISDENRPYFEFSLGDTTDTVFDLRDSLMLDTLDLTEQLEIVWSIFAQHEEDSDYGWMGQDLSLWVVPDQSRGEQQTGFPSKFEIVSLYPNPFNSTATVVISLAEQSPLTLSLYNLLGQRVGTLADGFFGPGNHTFLLAGDRLSSGIYLLQSEAAGQIRVKRITLVR